MGNHSQYSAILPSSFCHLGIICEDEYLVKLDFLPKSFKLKQATSPIAKSISQALNAYLHTKAYDFDIAIKVQGTEFQKRAWRAIARIPYGQTKTYGQLAKSLKTHPRAIGMAARTNPTPLIVPCHRIVGQNGIGGFAGQTKGQLINMKQWLINHEQVA